MELGRTEKARSVGLTLNGTPHPGDTMGLVRGISVGRYLLLDQIGEGGMGTVFAAYDPELDRKVALKLVAAESDSGSHARVLREAQALARLTHPNVVAVHDVGMFGDQIWIAMEFVAGLTLGAWVKEKPRAWSDVLRVLTDAARGVAAAHAVGLVHRDLKPDNVMVGNDGRVRVMDFGLAHGRHLATAAPALAATETGDTAVRPELAALELRLTRAGAVMGTPAYMAPEQWQGREADAAVDQFGWSVMAWEMLYGETPFAGETVVALAAMVLSGQRRPPQRRAKVPGWLRRVVERGLTVDSTRRWPSMTALIAALERGRTRARAQSAAIIGFLALSVGLLGILRVQAVRQDLCTGAEYHLVGVWDSERHEAVKRAILDTGVIYADDVWTRVADGLNNYTKAWIAMYTEACQATHVRGEQSGGLLDLRMVCLQRNLGDVRSLVAVLADADADIVLHANQAVASLPSLEPCADIVALQGKRPHEVTPELQRVRDELSFARAYLRTVRLRDGLAVTERAIALASQANDPFVLAEAYLEHGYLLDDNGEVAAAAAAFTEAFFSAEAIRDDRILTESAINLIHNSTKRADLIAAHQWERHASILFRRDVDDLAAFGFLECDLLNASGNLAAHEGQLDLAERYYNDALNIDSGNFNRAGILNNLGNILVRRGDLEQAETHLREAAELYRKELGEHHPNFAIALNNLAEVDARRGAWSKAESLYIQARTIFLAVSGSVHPNLGVVENNLGDVLMRLDRLDVAREHYASALDIFTHSFGPENPTLAYPLTGLGEIMLAEGLPREALPLLNRALVLRPDSEPTSLARTRFALARALVADGAAEPEARDLATAAREAYTTAGPAYERERKVVEEWLQGHAATP